MLCKIPAAAGAHASQPGVRIANTAPIPADHPSPAAPWRR